MTGKPGQPQLRDQHVYVGPEPVDTGALYKRARCAEAGAVLQFCGTVRNHNQQAHVRGLEYEAYAEMAADEIKRLILEAHARWPLWTVSAVHRTGSLAVGEVAVCVTVGASHREEAFLACRHIIDRLKASAPIWKRETLESGTERWVEEGRPEPPDRES